MTDNNKLKKFKEKKRVTYVIDIDRESFKDWHNRDIKESRCDKMLNDGGGYDPAAAGTIDLAKINNPGSEEHGTLYQWDGGHRKRMHQKTYGEDFRTMKAHVTEVEDHAEISGLYALKNVLSGKHKPNETFVHAYNAGWEDQAHQQLVDCGLKIDPNKSVSTGQCLIAGDPNGIKTSIEGFKNSVDAYGLEMVKEATVILKKAFPNHDDFPSELLQGVSCACDFAKSYYADNPAQGKEKRDYATAFVDELIRVGDNQSRVIKKTKVKKLSLRNVTSFLKGQGGAKHAKPAQCITLGLLKSANGLTASHLKDMAKELKRTL